MTQRKGASSRAAVTPEVREALDAGTLESATLSEALVVDFGRLAQRVAPRLPAEALARLDAAAGRGITQRMQLAAEVLRRT